jgi:hypothetical protein
VGEELGSPREKFEQNRFFGSFYSSAKAEVSITSVACVAFITPGPHFWLELRYVST